MNDEIQSYLETLLPEKELFFIEMEEYAREHKVPIMESTGIEVMLQLMRIQNPSRILEIGTAIGYSALRMASTLQQANITTIELDPERIAIAKDNIERSATGERITLLEGNALELGEEAAKYGPYDAIFIDAAKGQYKKFFELYKGMLTDQGCIYTDNVLFKGLVAQQEVIASKRIIGMVKKIQQYNDWLCSQQDFHTVIIPSGDGLALSRKI